MGLFDKIRRVLGKVEDVLPGSGGRKAEKPSGMPDAPAPTRATKGEERGHQADAPDSSSDEARAAVATGDEARGVDTAGADGPATGAPESPRRYRTHLLRQHQSLAAVAELHGVGVAELAELNGVDPELVFAGQVLRLPHDATVEQD